MTKSSEGYVVHLPLCPGEQVLEVRALTEAGDVPGKLDQVELWAVAGPRDPHAADVVLGRSSAFKVVTVPLTAPLPKRVDVAVITDLFPGQFRWKNAFVLSGVTTAPNGGESTDNETVSSAPSPGNC